MQRKETVVAKDEDEVIGKFLDALPEPDEVEEEVEEDDDDDDDDDGDDTDADEDEEGPAEPIALATAPRPRGRPRNPIVEPVLNLSSKPRGIRGPRSLTKEQSANSAALNANRKFQETAYQEIDSLLASLNFASRDYEIRLERLEPAFDENDVPCDGNLADYKDKITVGDIRRRFGGGTYLIKIFGPHPTTGRPGIIKQERFKIAGPPKPMKTQKNGELPKPDGTGELLRAVTEASERNQQRVIELMERTASSSSSLETILPALTPIFEKLFNQSEESKKLLMEAQREDRRRDEERRAEERRREEERRIELRREEEKKEERRREDERKAEEAKREQIREERERAKEEREIERERAREERERIREEMKAEASEKQRQHERDLAAQMERAKQDQQRQSEFMNMMTTFQQAQMDNMQARAENGGVEAVAKQLMLLKDLTGTLTGSDDEQTGFEKFTDGLDRIAQTVMPIAQQVITNAKKPAQPVQTQQQQPQRPIVVDIGPTNTAPRIVATVSPPTPPVTRIENPDQGSGPVNEAKNFAFPSANDDMLAAVPMLVKNVDLAIQRNMTPEQIVETILVPFEDSAAMLMSMVSGMDVDQLLEFITDNVPSDWAILSPRGEETITKAFELWQSREDVKGAA